MKKLVAFVGSPKRNGNIDTAVKEIIKEANDNNIETKIYYLNYIRITPCQSCKYCREHNSCCINDNMQQVYEDIRTADYLILSSPVYIHQISGLLKNLLDMFYPVTDYKHKPRFGIKKAIFVYSQAAPIPQFYSRYFRYTERSLKAMGIKTVKRLTIMGLLQKTL